jgi:iron complex outermembrane recepter protein
MSKSVLWLSTALAAVLCSASALTAQTSQPLPPAAPSTAATPAKPVDAVAVPEVVVQQPNDPPASAKASPEKPKVAKDDAAPKAKAQIATTPPSTPVPPAAATADALPALPPLAADNAVKLDVPALVSAPNFAAPISGQTVNSTDRETTKDRPVFRVGDILSEVPGISVKQGNGPRDIGVSIRGSNARNGFGVRNIVVFEDGFQVTQPDGLSRTDLTDPHAYAGADVFRGPSSSLFGNYATGGAINFRTRPGGEINGVEYGVDVGSFGYVNGRQCRVLDLRQRRARRWLHRQWRL